MDTVESLGNPIRLGWDWNPPGLAEIGAMFVDPPATNPDKILFGRNPWIIRDGELMAEEVKYPCFEAEVSKPCLVGEVECCLEEEEVEGCLEN